MILRLDPRFPLVWRNPFSLQIGIDPVLVCLDDVTAAEERVLAALAAGVGRSGLEMIAGRAGASGLETLLAGLAPALGRPAPHHESTVLVVGAGRTAQAIAETLAECGVPVVTAADAVAAENARCDIAVAVGHYVLSPDLRGVWLRRDTPHLPVVYTDTAAVVGPLVVPGITACLYCIDQYRRDADVSWPAIAAQLWGRRSSAETSLASREAAAIACRAVLDWLGGHTPSAASVRLDSQTGDVSRQYWQVHPECGCSVPGGNGSAAVSPRATATPRLPKTTRAFAARA